MMEEMLQVAEDKARDIIRGQAATIQQVLELEKVLRDGRKFGLARQEPPRSA